MTDNLTPSMRRAVETGADQAKGRQVQLDEGHEPLSPHGLRAELRSAKLRIGILERQLVHQKGLNRLLRESQPLATELAQNEEETSACP